MMMILVVGYFAASVSSEMACEVERHQEISESDLAAIELKKVSRRLAEDREFSVWYATFSSGLKKNLLWASRQKPSARLLKEMGLSSADWQRKLGGSQNDIATVFKKYAQDLDRYLAALLAAVQVSDSSAVSRRVMQTSAPMFGLRVTMDEEVTLGGVTTISAEPHIDIVQTPKRHPYAFYELVLTHELVHALFQSIDYEADAPVVKMRNGYEAWSYQKGSRQEILEGYTQYLALKALALLGRHHDENMSDGMVGAYKREAVLCALVTTELGDGAFLDWYTGETVTANVRTIATAAFQSLLMNEKRSARLAELVFMNERRRSTDDSEHHPPNPEAMEAIGIFSHAYRESRIIASARVEQRLPFQRGYLAENVSKQLALVRPLSDGETLGQLSIERLSGLYWYYLTKEQISQEETVTVIQLANHLARQDWMARLVAMLTQDATLVAVSDLAEKIRSDGAHEVEAARVEAEAWLEMNQYQLPSPVLKDGALFYPPLSVDDRRRMNQAKQLIRNLIGSMRLNDREIESHETLLRLEKFGWMGEDRLIGRLYFFTLFDLLENERLTKDQRAAIVSDFSKLMGRNWENPFAAEEFEIVLSPYLGATGHSPEQTKEVIAWLLSLSGHEQIGALLSYVYRLVSR